MSSVKVDVKWQKEVYNVEVDLEQPPAVFKTQLFSLTGVPIERQKIMGVKGGLLKDDADWGALGIKPGQKLTMMGTADKVPEAPKQEHAFMEDLPEEEQDTSGLGKYGAGLENLGNTCYMNSTLQCFYAVPELRASLGSYGASGALPGDAAHGLAVSARSLFARMARSAAPVPPLEFVLALRRQYPQFGQQGRDGHYMQQDAEECWTNLMYTLRERLKNYQGSEESAINHLFGTGLHTSLTCAETGEKIEEDSTSYMLKCNISLDVNHLGEGLRLGLREDREKTSAALGRLALLAGDSRVSRLPPYLVVQMVRFFYKADVQQKAKILRKVSFPLALDMYEFLTDAAKKALDGPREAAKEAEDRRVGLAKKAKTEKAEAPAPAPTRATATAASAGGDVEMRDGGAMPEAVAAPGPASHAGELTGKYELAAVLTHKGRSADSGHYVAWVKQEDGQWIQFDDDRMIPRKEEEVLTLAGGGDWHMAYLLLYRAVKVPADG